MVGWDHSQRFGYQARSKEICGLTGTVIPWQNKLVQTTGVNQSPIVRMAGIRRLRRHNHDEIKRDPASRRFAYWPEMDGITPATVPESS
jgi:hypothetical protein